MREAKGKERHGDTAKGRRGASPRPHACGFTLIEISIVLFIMLMMTAAVVPWMRTFAESTQLRSAARSIRSLIQFARSSAITQRTEYVVLFDVEQGEYWLSLLQFLDEESGNVVADSSRTSLSESLAAVAEADSADLSEEEKEETEGTFSRTGGILGIPKRLPNGIGIAHMSSPRNAGGSSEVDYVTFYPDGTAEEFEVYLQSGSGRVFLLSITEATGRTGIRELTVEEIEEIGLEIGQ